MTAGSAHPRSRRILRREEFRHVYRHGLRVGGRWMVLFGVPADEGDDRLGVTASRKVGGAVTRNRCRRRIRELYRRHAGTCGARPVRLVVNARRGCEEAPWSELEREFCRCLRTLRARLG